MRPGLPPLAVTAIAALASRLVSRAWPAPWLPPSIANGLSLALALLGLTACVAALRPFRRAGTTVDPTRPERATTLVTSGIYRWSRNPMYLGMLLLLAGWTLHLGSLVALLVVPACFLLYLDRFQVVAEERALATAFGEDYAAYARRVRRWI